MLLLQDICQSSDDFCITVKRTGFIQGLDDMVHTLSIHELYRGLPQVYIVKYTYVSILNDQHGNICNINIINPYHLMCDKAQKQLQTIKLVAFKHCQHVS